MSRSVPLNFYASFGGLTSFGSFQPSVKFNTQMLINENFSLSTKSVSLSRNKIHQNTWKSSAWEAKWMEGSVSVLSQLCELSWWKKGEFHEYWWLRTKLKKKSLIINQFHVSFITSVQSGIIGKHYIKCCFFSYNNQPFNLAYMVSAITYCCPEKNKLTNNFYRSHY